MITYQDIKAKQQLATECTQACLNKFCYMAKKLIDICQVTQIVFW